MVKFEGIDWNNLYRSFFELKDSLKKIIIYTIIKHVYDSSASQKLVQMITKSIKLYSFLKKLNN